MSLAFRLFRLGIERRQRLLIDDVLAIESRQRHLPVLIEEWPRRGDVVFRELGIPIFGRPRSPHDWRDEQKESAEQGADIDEKGEAEALITRLIHGNYLRWAALR